VVDEISRCILELILHFLFKIFKVKLSWICFFSLKYYLNSEKNKKSKSISCSLMLIHVSLFIPISLDAWNFKFVSHLTAFTLFSAHNK